MFSTPVATGDRVGSVPTELRRIARTFVDLQDARHTADYDHLASFPKATTQRHVDAAEYALALMAAHALDPRVQIPGACALPESPPHLTEEGQLLLSASASP